MGGVQLCGAVHDMNDADDAGEGLCWVVHDDVGNGSLMYMLFDRAWLKHKRGKRMTLVGPGGNGTFESGGMMCYLVEGMALLEVDVLALRSASGSV